MGERSGRPRKEGNGSQYSIRAVERATAVLNSFSFQSPELSLKEIAEATALSKPTAFRILSTLEPLHYVAVDSLTGKYRLGSRILELGGVARSSLALRKVARPHLNALQRATGATVLLGTLMNDELVYVDKRETDGPIRIVSDVGWRRSPHFGMLGMVLLAFQGEGEAQRLLEKSPLVAHTPSSLVDREAFCERLRAIRRDGYVSEVDEAIQGVWGVAAPVLGYGGSVVAAVGVAESVSERTEEKVARSIVAVTECAGALSRDMGHKKAGT